MWPSRIFGHGPPLEYSMWRSNFYQVCFQKGVKLGQKFRLKEIHKTGIHSKVPLILEPSYVHGKASRPLSGATIGQVLDSAAERFGPKEAIVVAHQNIRRSFAQFREEVDTLAAGLLATDLNRGDRVGIWSPNNYEWMLMQYATAKLGMVLVAINPAYREQELSHVLWKAEVRVLVVGPGPDHLGGLYESLIALVPEIREASPGRTKSIIFPKLDTIITMTDNYHRGALTFKDIISYGGAKERQMLPEISRQINMDDVVNIHFSSGTTGTPKAIPLTHHSLVNNAMFIGRRLNYDVTPEKVCLLVPLYHCFGSVAGTLCSVMYGCTTVIPTARFQAGAALTTISGEQCSSLYGTPTMFIDMMNHLQFQELEFTQVKTGIIGGAPCLPSLMYSIMTKFNCPGITVMYGSTETGPIVAAHHVHDNATTKLGGVGSALDHVEIKIVDPDNYKVTNTIGCVGEICVRGPMIMKGYLDEQKTNDTLKADGWFLTGDLGTINGAGQLQVESRKKDMICRGGEKIFPREVENFIMQHGDVQDAHVFGIPDERMGEEVCVWIKTSEGKFVTETDIKTFCKSKIAHFKVPKHIKFVDDFPKNEVGKVSKDILRELMLKQLSKGRDKKMKISNRMM